MSDYFNRKLFDKSFKIQSNKKHLNSHYHKSLSMSIISRHSVTNPDFVYTDDILKNSVLDYNKKFKIYKIIFKWKLHFLHTIVSVKLNLIRCRMLFPILFKRFLIIKNYLFREAWT